MFCWADALASCQALRQGSAAAQVTVLFAWAMRTDARAQLTSSSCLRCADGGDVIHALDSRYGALGPIRTPPCEDRQNAWT